jgi:hypothetical protein
MEENQTITFGSSPTGRRLCVTARDRQPTHSFTSCAPIRLERALSRR